MTAFHRELRAGRFIPPVRLSRFFVEMMQKQRPTGVVPPEDVLIEDAFVPASEGRPALRVRVYRPSKSRPDRPLVYWMHGGGYVYGNPEMDDTASIGKVRDLGAVVVSVDYRVAPKNPYPAALDDAQAGLEWAIENAEILGIDTTRIAVGGVSAGGGLAAALVLKLHDEGLITPVFQVLVYPMLDDRSVLRKHHPKHMRVWLPQNNRFGWRAYLAAKPGSSGITDYQAPARRRNFSGLPPAWIGVGTNDLFHDEDREYARQLEAAGVSCSLHVVEGAFHGFDAIFGATNVSREFELAQRRALAQAFQHPGEALEPLPHP